MKHPLSPWNLAELWENLTQVQKLRHHEWRTGSFATVGLDGRPVVRTVVLREFIPTHQAIAFYTDERSPKIKQLTANPFAELMLWSPKQQIQIRLSGRCHLECWQQGPSQRLQDIWKTIEHRPSATDYLSPSAPGSSFQDLDHHEDRPAHPHLARILLEIEGYDLLFLDRSGHRRYSLSREGELRTIVP